MELIEALIKGNYANLISFISLIISIFSTIFAIYWTFHINRSRVDVKTTLRHYYVLSPLGIQGKFITIEAEVVNTSMKGVFIKEVSFFSTQTKKTWNLFYPSPHPSLPKNPSLPMYLKPSELLSFKYALIQMKKEFKELEKASKELQVLVKDTLGKEYKSNRIKIAEVLDAIKEASPRSSSDPLLK